MFRITYSNGRVDDGYETIEDAVEALRADYPELEYGHDGDLEDHGERTLCWASQDAAEQDEEGVSAIASIERSATKEELLARAAAQIINAMDQDDRDTFVASEWRGLGTQEWEWDAYTLDELLAEIASQLEDQQ